jgi:hypothetical protein
MAGSMAQAALREAARAEPVIESVLLHSLHAGGRFFLCHAD